MPLPGTCSPGHAGCAPLTVEEESEDTSEPSYPDEPIYELALLFVVMLVFVGRGVWVGLGV